MIRRAAWVLVVALVVPSLVVAGRGAGQPAVAIEIVHTGDADSRAVAEESLHLLREVARLPSVAVSEATTAAAFLDRVAASRADALVLVGHGSAAGLLAGDTIASWADIARAVESSRATHLFVGACESARLPSLARVSVHLRFEGAVDARVVAPSVADALVRELFPDEDAAFTPRLLAYVESQGDLSYYARLILVPERPLGSSPAECAAILREWHEGRGPSADVRSGCLFALGRSSLNCHAAASHGEDACRDFSADDQERWNAESVPSGEARYGDGSEVTDSSTQPWYSWLAQQIGVEIEDEAAGTSVTLGPAAGPASCVSMITVEDIFSGGTTPLIRAALRRVVADLRKDAAIAPSADGSILALRLCGQVVVVVPKVTTGAASYVGADGEVDVRLATFIYVDWDVPVFRWRTKVSIGFQGGVAAPMRLGLHGSLTRCEDGGFGYRIDAPLEAGPLNLFVQGYTLWAETGWKQEFGGKLAHTFELHRACPGNDASALGLPSRGPAIERLMAAGFARVNDAPTRVHLGPEGVESFVKSSFVAIRPGSATWNRLSADGGLDALGVPAHVDPSSMLVLDPSHGVAARALGLRTDALFVPRYSLVTPAVIVPAGTPLSDATDGLCARLAAVSALAANAHCDGASLAPLRGPKAGGCAGYYGAAVLGAAGADVQGGALDEGSTAVSAGSPGNCAGDFRPIGDVVERALVENQTVACGERALVQEAAPYCAYAEGETSGEGAITGLVLLANVHQTFTILSRPSEALWFLDGCSVKVDRLGFDSGQTIEAAKRDVGNVGWERLGVCMNATFAPGAPVVPHDVVLLEYEQGWDVLANLAASAPATFVAAAEGQPPIEPPDLVGAVKRLVYDPACPHLAPLYECGAP